MNPMNLKTRAVAMLYYYELGFLGVFSVVGIFANDWQLLVFLILGILVGAWYTSLHYHYKKEKQENLQRDREVRLFPMVFTLVFCTLILCVRPATPMKDILYFFVILGIFVTYRYGIYIREKNFQFYEEIKQKKTIVDSFQANVWLKEKKIFLLCGIFAVVLCSLTMVNTLAGEDWEWENDPVYQAREQVIKKKKNENSFALKKKEEEKKKGRGLPVVLIRRMAWVLILFSSLTGLAVVVFLIYLSVKDRTKTKYVKEEISGFSYIQDEYTSLKPVKKERGKYPDSPEGKIRKLFVQYVKKNGTKGEKAGGKTAEEWVRGFGGKPEVSGLYNKARYGSKGVSEEEVTKMKQWTQT